MRFKFMILVVFTVALPVNAQSVAGGTSAVIDFKPMVKSPLKPQAQPPPLVATPNAPVGVTPFPKMIPQPNIGSLQTPSQAKTIVDNYQQIPPDQRMPNTTQPSFDQLLKNILSGGPSATYPNGGSGTSPDGTIFYPGTSSDDGDIGFHDRAGTGRIGNKCNPGVNSDYASVYEKVAIKDTISKIAGARCDEHPTDRLVCMACNLYFEVDPHDSYKGYVAVARSVMTRAASRPYPRTVCGVIYQHSERVAQYSWTFESPKWNPNHKLPLNTDDERLKRVFQASVEAFAKGPNGFTNYYAQNLVTPKWSREGSCSATLCTVEHHTFCAINANQDRSPASYLRAEGISAVASAGDTPSATPNGASK